MDKVIETKSQMIMRIAELSEANERLQAEYDDLQLSYAGCKTVNTGLQELNQKLQAENEQLKKLKFKSDGIELLQDANLNLHKANVKYRQALQEIRDICKMDCGDCEYNQDCDCNFSECEESKIDDILDKINEVIGEK